MKKIPNEILINGTKVSLKDYLKSVLKAQIMPLIPFVLSLGIVSFLNGILESTKVFSLSLFILGFSGILNILSRYEIASSSHLSGQRALVISSSLFTILLWIIAIRILLM